MKKKITLSCAAWLSRRRRGEEQALEIGLSAYTKWQEFIDCLCGAGKILGSVHLINAEMQ